MKYIIIILAILFLWALVHGGTRNNEYYDDYWGSTNDD